MTEKKGRASVSFGEPPRIIGAASIVGSKEGDGPLGHLFDVIEPDPRFGKNTWEEAESELQLLTARKAMEKAGMNEEQIRYLFAGDLLAQGIGTSMLQVPNIVRKPIIWIPPILASAILGPISTVVLKMTNNAIGSGMGTAGFVGQLMGYETMVSEGVPAQSAFLEILVMHIIVPAILTYVIAEFMRNKGLIKNGDMKLDL